MVHNTSEMEPSEILHRLFYFALLDIRSEGRETDNKIVFHLADLFHNVALAMGQAARGEREYAEVLAMLEERAAANGCQDWLNNQIRMLKSGENVAPDEIATGLHK